MATTDSPARQQRDKERKLRELERQKHQFDEDKRALKRLIRFYTARKDWFMVERLMNDLGNIFEGD